MAGDPTIETQSRSDRTLIFYLSLIGFSAGFLLALAVAAVFILPVRDPPAGAAG